MRDQWYGDNRDLVKWSVLVHLARREAVSAILHVAMYRPGPAQPPLATARGKVDPPAEVFRHFRDLDDIQRLAVATGLAIEVVKELFTDRLAYFERVCERIKVKGRRGGPMLVLLDPDVGLAPDIHVIDNSSLSLRGVISSSIRDRRAASRSRAFALPIRASST